MTIPRLGGRLGSKAAPALWQGESAVKDAGVIGTFLGVFTGYIDSGFGLLGGEVAFLSSTLIAIDVTIAALFWAWGADEDVLQRLVKKTRSEERRVGKECVSTRRCRWLA